VSVQRIERSNRKRPRLLTVKIFWKTLKVLVMKFSLFKNCLQAIWRSAMRRLSLTTLSYHR
jgi:hypothetical protein